MSWRTNRAVLVLRNIGRATGINSRVAAILFGGAYEDRFQAAMLGAISAGSCVWDVGANVGLYSTQFSQRAGPTGKVFAFEPSPSNLNRLRAAVAPCENVTVMATALGEREGVATFEQGADSLGATSRIVADGMPGTVSVPVASGDQLVASGAVALPTVIKIDTEGFELDVLRGLSKTLRSPDLRALCIEIHFGILESRGLAKAPSDIERLLAEAGFSVAWPDASHIVATRAR